MSKKREIRNSTAQKTESTIQKTEETIQKKEFTIRKDDFTIQKKEFTIRKGVDYSVGMVLKFCYEHPKYTSTGAINLHG